ncbi:copper chaperone CopZ [Metabacillus niabensis]|uniref:copper chaperone CopZ n=1 Tax=Metabacillus niabensis TaxID=324854 RepID=UPI001CF967E4|nr:copper chaperone CopZ [Metabacillus niabensis]
MEKTTLTVQGMSCGHCVSAIEGNVGKQNGVENVKVHLTEGKVDIEFDPVIVSLDKIKEIIDEQGYDVV